MKLKEREFTFSATFSLPSPSSDLKVPNKKYDAGINLRELHSVTDHYIVSDQPPE